MRPLRVVAFATVAIVGLAVLASFAGASGAIGVLDEESKTEPTANASLGVQMGSFMQSSSTNTESAVSEGMFDAEYQEADDRAAVLDNRAADLEVRLTALRQQKAELEDAENDVRTQVRMSRIASEIHSLEREVNNSASLAKEAGHSGAPFDDLSKGVADLRGPEVAEAAGAIPGGPAPSEVGPPDSVPGAGDDTGPSDEKGSERKQDPQDKDSQGEQADNAEDGSRTAFVTASA